LVVRFKVRVSGSTRRRIIWLRLDSTIRKLVNDLNLGGTRNASRRLTTRKNAIRNLSNAQANFNYYNIEEPLTKLE